MVKRVIIAAHFIIDEHPHGNAVLQFVVWKMLHLTKYKRFVDQTSAWPGLEWKTRRWLIFSMHSKQNLNYSYENLPLNYENRGNFDRVASHFSAQ